MTWKPAGAIPVLFAQINNWRPDRDKRTDGVVGDAAHQARPSDHNPDSRGWVHAMDVDKDLGLPSDPEDLADSLLEYARTKQPGSDRLKNIVFRDRVASGTYPDQYWTWRPGKYAHFDHIHISFTNKAELDVRPFDLSVFRVVPDVPHPVLPTLPGDSMLIKVVLDKTTFWLVNSGKTVNINSADAATWKGDTLTVTDATAWGRMVAAWPVQK
jgi:hypothetical protein